MRIIGIDPGTEQAAMVRTVDGKLQSVWIGEPSALGYVLSIWAQDLSSIAIEGIESFGQVIGQSTIDTARWIGRYEQIALAAGAPVVHVIPRSQIKLTIAGSRRANDQAIRQCILDRFGGERKTVVGTKKQPGPLFGISGHAWQALAVALTAEEIARKDGGQ